MTTTRESYPFFFTWTDQRSARPMALAGGQGSHFVTADGERWLDLGSLSYQASLGHGHAGVTAAIIEQARTLALATPSAVFPAKLALADRLLALAPPGFSKVFFTLGGAEANENAIKIARTVTGRHKVLARYRSYHGATLGALSLTGDWRRFGHEPLVPGAVHVLDCYCDRCPFGKSLSTCARECATHVGDVIELEGPASVAAVILEPVVGANGVLIPPPEYWPIVRAACDRHGALLIADEVLTGFGRTGKCFAFEHWGVVPDIITCAKAITGGYAPLGAVLVHDRVAAHFHDRVLSAGLTSYAHPLACAAGAAALDAYESGRLFERAAQLEPVLRAGLDDLAARPGVRVAYTRAIGLLGAVELELAPAAWRALDAELAARKLFVHVYPGRGTVVFAPPLVIEAGELAAGMRAFADAVEAAAAACAAPADPDGPGGPGARSQEITP